VRSTTRASTTPVPCDFGMRLSGEEWTLIYRRGLSERTAGPYIVSVDQIDWARRRGRREDASLAHETKLVGPDASEA
jgi:hypothetical protein